MTETKKHNDSQSLILQDKKSFSLMLQFVLNGNLSDHHFIHRKILPLMGI